MACLPAWCSTTWDNCLMQGFERADRKLLDAEMLAGHLVPAGSMFAFLAAHRAEVFPDADYADLFAPPGFGRPSLPATRMAAVLALQTLYDYSDSALLGAPYTSRHATYDLRRLRRKQVIERLPRHSPLPAHSPGRAIA